MTGLPILDQPQHRAGAVELALAELWRVKSGDFYTLKNLWTVLRLRRRFSLTMLTIEKLKVAIPRGQVPDCENCLDLCCTGPNAVVSLRLRDIAVLMDLGLTSHIARDRPQAPPPPTTPPRKQKAAAKAAAKALPWARREAEASVFHHAFPTLVRDPTGTCSLLTEDRLCSVFPSWPLSCARYPYALDLRNGVIFYAKGCRSTRIAEVSAAPLHVRRLVRAVVESSNARVRDIVLLATAKPELEQLGLLAWVKVEGTGL